MFPLQQWVYKHVTTLRYAYNAYLLSNNRTGVSKHFHFVFQEMGQINPGFGAIVWGSLCPLYLDVSQSTGRPEFRDTVPLLRSAVRIFTG